MKELLVKEQFGSTMVIVPHQDDEILMAAGLMYQIQKKGVPLSVVMVTNGDYECRDYSKGRARLRETIAGMKVLGIPAKKLTILGYADTGMPEEESFLTHLFKEKDELKIYPSSCGSETYGLEDIPDLHSQCFGCHGAYNRKTLKEDLKRVISDSLPANIVTTAECDMHGDHSGLYQFVTEVLDELRAEKGYTPGLYCGLIHSCAGDDCWPLPDTAVFDCPEGLEEISGLKWEDRLVLKMPEGLRRKDGKQNLKYQSLSRYEIALEPNAAAFLMSFIKDEEIFWKIR